MVNEPARPAIQATNARSSSGPTACSASADRQSVRSGSEVNKATTPSTSPAAKASSRSRKAVQTASDASMLARVAHTGRAGVLYISGRYIGPIYRTATPATANGNGHDRTGDPGTAEGAAHARIPAQPRALRAARRPLARVLRVPLPVASPPRAARRDHQRAGHRRSPQDRVRDHAGGGAALPRAAGGDPAREPDRGREVPGAARVLPVPPARDASATARATPPGARDTFGRREGASPRRRGDHRRLPARAARSRARRHRVGHRLAHRADPHRTTEVRDHRPCGGAAPRERDAAQEGAHIMSEVRIAIVGLGNCASSLIQGLVYYNDAAPNESVPGLMHVELGGYHIRDIEVVAAFDVDAKKVGTDV